MAFEFVENDKIDARSRKLIRSHVMKGKNVGKTRRRPAVTKEPDTTVLESNTDDVLVCSSSDDSDSPSTIARPLGDDVGYFTFPAKLDLATRNIIYQCTPYAL